MIYHVSMKRRVGEGRRPRGHAGNTDEEFRGSAQRLPIEGMRWMVVGYPDQQHPYLHTSAVKTVARIEEDQRLVGLVLETQNSIYDVKISHTEGEGP